MPRHLTVAHVTGESGFSGGEVQVFLLMEGLRKRSHTNVLVCPLGSASDAEARRRGIETRPVPLRSEWSLRGVHGIRRELRDIGPDVVHLHTGRANWLGGLAAWHLDLPAITTRRMDRSVKRNLRTRFLYGSCVHRAVAISHAVGHQLMRAGVPESMVRVVRSAVAPEALHPQNGREATRATLGLGADTVCLLAIASLVRRKGIDVLLQALALLREAGLRPALCVAGEGPQRARLERITRQRGLSDQVRFLGQRDDTADLLVASDLFVLPSRQEGLGVAALEAMALGRPIVASRVGGLAEVVDQGRSGLLVPPDDARALGDAIAKLVEDRGLRERLGAAGPPRVRKDFSLDGMVGAYERIYADVTEERRR